MKVAVLANLMTDAPESPEDPPGRWDDLDDIRTVNAICSSLEAYGYQVSYFPAGPNLVADLTDYSPDICFNISEGHFGASREAQIPALLDLLQIPYTGSGVMAMMIAHNKHIAKNIFYNVGLPTSPFMVFENPKSICEPDIPYPLFVKPANEGSSIGINENAVVHSFAELVRQVSWSYSVVKAPILIEKYIDGREFTISMLGDEIFPIVEVVSSTGYYSNALKESVNSGVYRVCPAQITDEMAQMLRNITMRAKKALDLSDFCRMDLRMDLQGNPYILEVNPLPLLYPDPEQSSFVYASLAAGYSYEEVVNKIMIVALNRLGLRMPLDSYRENSASYNTVRPSSDLNKKIVPRLTIIEKQARRNRNSNGHNTRV